MSKKQPDCCDIHSFCVTLQPYCQECAGVRLSAMREARNTPACHQAEERTSPPATLVAAENIDNKVEKHHKYI